MTSGLVFGKFLPFHKGHEALINFALLQCNILYVIVCASDKENISGLLRREWIQATIKKSVVEVLIFNYNEELLPNTSVSSKEVSEKWAAAFSEILPPIDRVFTSEPYGDYVAAAMKAIHMPFDVERARLAISATAIRNNPFVYWDFLPVAVQPYYVKKIIILGSESTGKSTMTKKLAAHFNTTYVQEMARDIVEHTETCKFEHMQQIALLHAQEIKKQIIKANKLLFIDTDINITRSYSRFLFGKELNTDDWINEINKGDLYIFLEPDCTYVQDGTRLENEERLKLNTSHKNILDEQGIIYHSINGSDWNERLEKAIMLVNNRFMQ